MLDPKPTKRAPQPKGKVRAQYVVTELPKDALLEIPYVAGAPQLTVLSVDNFEGGNFGEFWNRWRYVLTWTG